MRIWEMTVLFCCFSRLMSKIFVDVRFKKTSFDELSSSILQKSVERRTCIGCWCEFALHSV